MFDKKMIIDFINYGIIASIFLVIPYTITLFLAIIIPLIFDLITLYFIEKKEAKHFYNFEDDYLHDSSEG